MCPNTTTRRREGICSKYLLGMGGLFTGKTQVLFPRTSMERTLKEKRKKGQPRTLWERTWEANNGRNVKHQEKVGCRPREVVSSCWLLL